MVGGGGLLQLVAVGKQDVFLTGNPQTTFFKTVYRRHTNFAIESQPMYFDGTPNFGGKITCLVPRRGDLLGQVILEVTLPKINIPDNTDSVSYVNSIGHALIQEISLEIGEQEIDKQTGEWMEIWSNLTTVDSKKYGFYNMIGKVDSYVPPDNYGPIKLYIPLQFWFCKTPGLYLPLLALQYHPVRVVLTLRKLQDLFYIPNMTINCSTQVVTAGGLDIMLWGDYVYLDKEERRHFVKNTHEYLIEQVQYTANPQSIPKNNITQTIRLEFNHPIREMIWVLSRKRNQNYHEWFNYSSLSLEEEGVRTDLLANALLQLDGYDRFQVREAGYFRLVQPWQFHSVIPNDDFIYLYSFALRPEDLQPTGSMNASRIDNIVLQLGMNQNLTADERGDIDVMVYVKNHNVLRIAEGFGGVLFTV
jgi:hypothetical protein